MPRGRPKKKAAEPNVGTKEPKKGTVYKKETSAKSKQQEPEKVYNHVRYQRCDKKLDGSQYPTFMKDNMTCGGLMHSTKTTDGGKIKHYKCEICGTIRKVEGELV